MTLLSWNVANRLRGLRSQIEAVQSRAPDIVALQEITSRKRLLWVEGLGGMGLASHADSLSVATEPELLRGPRRYGVLIASRWPLHPLPTADMPWPERLLSVLIETPQGPVELHTAHIPPGASNGWRKVETLEGIFRRLACPRDAHRILCGDFNTPQEETADGRIISWAYGRTRGGGYRLLPSKGTRWDAAELQVLEGLARFDLANVYTTLHGVSDGEYSWYTNHRGHRQGRRFDHVFASVSLHPVRCEYLHAFREAGLSDHSPIEVQFSPGGRTAPSAG